jgi:hypothetical protein
MRKKEIIIMMKKMKDIKFKDEIVKIHQKYLKIHLKP